VEALVPQTFLAKVPRALATEVLSMGRRVDIPANLPLTSSAAKPGLAIVVEGLVRSFLTSPERRQVTVRYARPGETLGLVQLLRGRLDVQAQAVTPVVLWAMSSRRLRGLALESAPLAMAIAEDCAERVADAADELALVTFGSVRQRVARHLLDLAAAEGEGGELVAVITPKRLADAAGSVREVVARVLRELDAAGTIRRSERTIAILDAARLDEEARGLGGVPQPQRDRGVGKSSSTKSWRT
jgi:CRP/FNR family cyclic AMP-dependent transcriptional regulator